MIITGTTTAPTKPKPVPQTPKKTPSGPPKHIPVTPSSPDKKPCQIPSPDPNKKHSFC